MKPHIIIAPLIFHYRSVMISSPLVTIIFLLKHNFYWNSTSESLGSLYVLDDMRKGETFPRQAWSFQSSPSYFPFSSIISTSSLLNYLLVTMPGAIDVQFSVSSSAIPCLHLCLTSTFYLLRTRSAALQKHTRTLASSLLLRALTTRTSTTASSISSLQSYPA